MTGRAVRSQRPRATCGLFLLAASCFATNAAEMLTLHMVTGDGTALAGTRLEWWPDDGRRDKRQAACDRDRCATWRLPLDPPRANALHLVLLVPRAGQDGCWDLHTGIARIGESEKPLHEAVIEMDYAHAVCN